MEHVNGWCFRGIYKGGLWENDLHVSALLHSFRVNEYASSIVPYPSSIVVASNVVTKNSRSTSFTTYRNGLKRAGTDRNEPTKILKRTGTDFSSYPNELQ